jgi:hypothetical protein
MGNLIAVILGALLLFLLVGFVQPTPAVKNPHPRNYARPDQFDQSICTTNWAHNSLQDVPLFKNFASSVPSEVHLRY